MRPVPKSWLSNGQQVVKINTWRRQWCYGITSTNNLHGTNLRRIYLNNYHEHSHISHETSRSNPPPPHETSRSNLPPPPIYSGPLPDLPSPLLTEHGGEQAGTDERHHPEASLHAGQVPSDRRSHDEAHAGDSVEPADDALTLRGRLQIDQQHPTHGLRVLERSWVGRRVWSETVGGGGQVVAVEGSDA